jgi:hypothetical protein
MSNKKLFIPVMLVSTLILAVACGSAKKTSATTSSGSQANTSVPLPAPPVEIKDDIIGKASNNPVIKHEPQTIEPVLQYPPEPIDIQDVQKVENAPPAPQLTPEQQQAIKKKMEQKKKKG